MLSVVLSGGTLLFVLNTAGASRRTFRAAAVVVSLGVIATAIALVLGDTFGATAAGVIGLLLAVVAPLVILRRIALSPTITFRLVLGALCIYLLLGLAYAYLFPLIATVTNEPFFVQTKDPDPSDYVYFSYTTLATIGYGDFTAAGSLGRMIAVSEGLRRTALPRLGGRPAGRQHRPPAPRACRHARRHRATSRRPVGNPTGMTDGRPSLDRGTTRQSERSTLLRVEAPGSSPGGFFVSSSGTCPVRSVRSPGFGRRAAAGRSAGSRRRGSTRHRSARRAGRSSRTVAPPRRRSGRSRSPSGAASARRPGPSTAYVSRPVRPSDAGVSPGRNWSGRMPMPTRFERWIRSKLSAITNLHAKQGRALGRPVA